jgi:hypothetical protein
MHARRPQSLEVTDSDIVSSQTLNLQPSALDELIQRIGAEIYRHGSCLVSQEELVLIFNGAVDGPKKRARICAIAIRYNWAFELSDRMTSVRFKELSADETATGIIKESGPLSR